MKIKNFGSSFSKDFRLQRNNKDQISFYGTTKKKQISEDKKISEKRKTLIQSQFFSPHDFRRNEMINERKGF